MKKRRYFFTDPKPKILVTSAAGNTGIPTTLQLLEKGFPVRAFARSNDHRAKRLEDAGAEIFVGDQYSITDMRRAMDGVQRAYHCVPAAPNPLHFGTVFAIAAQEAKLEHVVMLGQWLSHKDHPSVATREVWLNEEVLRVRPETLCRITEFSEHESNGRELDEGERVAVEVLPVLGRPAAAVEPGDGAFDHPTPGLDDEALHPIGSLDDLGLEIGQDAGQGAVKDRPLIGAVGEQFPEKGKQTEQGRQQRETAVAILNVGGGDDAVQQQALRIDQNMPLLALDQLAGIEAVAVDASPPFSALFTL